MHEDRVKSEYNQNENISARVAALQNDCDKAWIFLRDDGMLAYKFLDLISLIWREINTVSSMKDNANTYKADIDAMLALKNELYSKAAHEVRRSMRYSAEHPLQKRGASAEFLLKSDKLAELVWTLAQRFGFGMSTKRFSDIDTATSFRRAAD